jgi:hypothetical protein
MREGKSEVRAPNGFVSKVIEALELGIFDKMVEILGKNAFISGHIYSIPQIKKAIDNGNLDKIKKEFGDYFITDFNKSRNVEEISESMKLGTFDTMYKHLGYSFFGDTSHSYGCIKAISQTVLDKTFDEIIKSLGNKFFDSFGVSSINIVSQSVKKGDFAKILQKIELDNEKSKYYIREIPNFISIVEAVNTCGIDKFNKIVDTMGKDFILKRANGDDIKNLAKLIKP